MKSATSNKAQISLELILVMSVFFSVLLLFTPLISKTFFLGIYALDVIKAKNFSDSFSITVNELNSMSNESKIILTAEPLMEWKIKLEQEKLFLVIIGKQEKQKEFVSEQFNTLPLNEIKIKEKTVFGLTKTEQGILIQIQNT